MKKEYILAFVNAIKEIIEMTVYEEPRINKPYALADRYIVADEVAVTIGITGGVSGQVVLSMTKDCAKGIAEKMIEEPLLDFSSDARSAISELSNMISGKATIELARVGVSSDISTPSLIMAKGMQVSCSKNSFVIVIPIELSAGEIVMNLALKESPDMSPAVA